MARCCPCNGEGARCVRCVCVKKNRSCSSCCPKKSGTCRNLKLTLNQPTLNQATSGQSSSSSHLSTCSSLKSTPFDSPSALTDVFVDGSTSVSQNAAPSSGTSSAAASMPISTSTDSVSCLPSLSEIVDFSTVPTLRHIPKGARDS